MYQTIKVELTTQNILNGQTNPIPVLPSLPSNQAYRVVDFCLYVSPGSTPFTNDAGIVVTSDPSNMDAGQLTCGGLDSSSEKFVTALSNGNIHDHIHPGEGLFLQCYLDSTAGDGLATAYITYHVLDL
jgi:hypothetical protein